MIKEFKFTLQSNSSSCVASDYSPLDAHNVRLLFVHSTKQSMMVQNLDPNTHYEFVVRLHVDQMSSPWSSVVYNRTLPAGKKLDITVT